MFEFIDHTADVGLRIHGSSLAAALAEAGRGFSSLIVENLDDVRPVDSVRIELPLEDRASGSLEYLLFDWLSALLHDFEATGRVCSSFDVREQPPGIVADCRGEPIDPQRHRLCYEIKAVTYHQLEFHPTVDGYAGQVILDV